MNRLYENPDEYDLEHLGDDEDIEFYLALIRRLKPARVLELGCGTGRLTLPITLLAGELNFKVVGLDNQPQMLKKARQRLERASAKIRTQLKLVNGDMRKWRAELPFDLILIPCSSITHVLSLDDQIEVWRQCRENLAPGGRFIVEVNMPKMDVLADSFRTPPRMPIELDIDNLDERDKTRLIRRKTTQYMSDEQHAHIRFLYEKYRDGRLLDSFIDDFQSHIFFPRELRLLFMLTGYTVEECFGDYRSRPLRASSPMVIMVGRRN